MRQSPKPCNWVQDKAKPHLVPSNSDYALGCPMCLAAANRATKKMVARAYPFFVVRANV
jgi:hypothetical protein